MIPHVREQGPLCSHPLNHLDSVWLCLLLIWRSDWSRTRAFAVDPLQVSPTVQAACSHLTNDCTRAPHNSYIRHDQGDQVAATNHQRLGCTANDDCG
jgi:hypothetical protein